MAKFHNLKVADIRRETADAVSLAFDVPAGLQSEFKFIQGQYLTLKLMVNGEEVRRSYSICSGVDENELRVAVKRVKEGKGSNFLNEKVKKGDSIEVMTPMGSFHSPMNASHAKHYYLFAGGSGITPMFSIIKTVLSKEPKSKLTLFYGNLNEEATIFKSSIDELSGKNKDRLSVYYVFEKPSTKISDLQTGLISKDKAGKLFDEFVKTGDNEFFICGPKPMMDNVRETLESKNVDKPRIHIEYFTSAIDAPESTANASEIVKAKVTVIQYGIETEFELSTDGKSILDAAVDAGVDAPFACKGAVCATCRGKVIEGKVHMNKNFALTDAEVAEGHILTCQSHPITPVVKVDYDV